MLDDILSEAETRMKNALDALTGNFNKIRMYNILFFLLIFFTFSPFLLFINSYIFLS